MFTIPFPDINSKIPSWNLESIFGENVPTKEDFLGKPLLILFFNLGCPGCVGRAIPFANRMTFEHGNDLNVLGIHTNFEGVDFTKGEFEKFKSELFIRFPFFKDYNYDTSFINFKAGGTPHWFLIDEHGKLSYAIFGSDPNNALLRLDYKINEILMPNKSCEK